MALTLSQALALCAQLIAIAVAIQSIELLVVRRAFASDGIWVWPVLAQDYAGAPRLRAMLSGVMGYRGFVALLALRLLAAVSVLFGVSQLGLPVMLITSLLVCVRFRGTYNGGSDSMVVLVLLALALQAAAPANELLARGCLGYIAVQATLSYVLAGLVKLKEPTWRSGRVLRAIAQLPQYRAPQWIERLLSEPFVAKLCAWSLIAFECGAPLAWLHPQAAWAFVLLGLCFHLGNAVAFGLNQFTFAWAASYPALLYFSQLLHA